MNAFCIVAYVIAGLLAIVLIALAIPVKMNIRYDKQLKVVLIILGFLKFDITEGKKPKKEKSEHISKEEEPKKEEKQSYILTFLKNFGKHKKALKKLPPLVIALLKSLVKNIQVGKSVVKVYGNTAMLYGYGSTFMYLLAAWIQETNKIEKLKLYFEPDFSKAKVEVYTDVNLFCVPLSVLLGIVKYMKKKEKIEENKKKKDVFCVDNKLEDIMEKTVEKINEMANTNAVVGEPITTADGTCIIPISKISYGFGSGGSDLPSKNEKDDLFGGGGGAGVTISPVAFLTVSNGNIRLLQLEPFNSSLDRAIEMMPDLISKITGVVKNKQSNKKDKKSKDKIEEDIDIKVVTGDGEEFIEE